MSNTVTPKVEREIAPKVEGNTLNFEAVVPDRVIDRPDKETYH
jgi:hypothetical protein